MRVVETYTGGIPQQTSNTPQVQSSTTTTGAVSTSQVPAKVGSPALTGPNSIQAIGLRTVTGQTVVPPQSSQPSSAPFANSPAPMSGTVSAVSVNPQQVRPIQVRITSHGTGPGAQTMQVVHPVSASPLSPSMQRPVSPVVTQIQAKPLPPEQATTPVNHIQVKTVPAAPASLATPQVSSHSLMQQVYTPTFGTETVTEEAWATAWLKGGFEPFSGTSIEEGELYRMYCAARKKHPASMLSQAQLVQCVK